MKRPWSQGMEFTKRGPRQFAKWIVVLLLSALKHLGAQPAGQPHQYFTVRDSITMARFGRNEKEPLFSPNRKYFAVVTSRGIPETNEIASMLWLVDTGSVLNSLRGKEIVKYAPAASASVAAVPRRLSFDSYAALITDLKWSPDSKSLLFLAQRSDGQRELRQLAVAPGETHTAASGNYDVMQYDVAQDVIAFAAQPITDPETQSMSEPKAVTGLPLARLLFPSKPYGLPRVELWVSKNGLAHKVTNPLTGQPIVLSPLPASQNVMAISPDARSLVVLLPSSSIPPSWESFIPDFDYLKVQSGSPDRHGAYRPAQYALVDLDTGREDILIDAPNAWSLGSADQNQAKWARSGKKLLLTNSYLPPGSRDGSNETLHRCVAVMVDLVSKSRDCLLFANYDRAFRYLLYASFGRDDNEVVLTFWNSPDNIAHEEFNFENDKWKFSKILTDAEYEAHDHGRTDIGEPDFWAKIREGLNTPPALWAGSRTLAEKKIWDPNPQLASVRLGEASEFRWKDKTGYEWLGGLVKPPDYHPGRRYPLVIQTHGFKRDEFMTDGAYTTAFAARPLAAEGMIVLQMPTRHDHQVTGAEAPEQVEGFRSAIERLVDEGLVDREKVGIIGFSRTCYYVESALIAEPELFAAATLADGVDESYMQYLLFGVGISNEESEQIYGSPPFGAGLKEWVEHAPGFHLDRVSSPLRIEAIGPGSLLEEWEIYGSLWKQGKPVDLIYLPEGQHILQKPVERLASQQGNVDWFRFWLKGEEDPAPGKAAQYERWKQMRDLQVKKVEGRRIGPTPSKP
jgi:dipeptidyl aminopeptidase/acylaminoacyl peptidase